MSKPMSSMTLYYLDVSPPCRAVLLTIRTLGLDVKIRHMDLFGKKEHKENWFVKMNPAHTVPTLDDNGTYLWESRAIMTYLVQKYSRSDAMYPQEAKARAQVDKMLYFDACTLYPAIHNYFWLIIGEGQEPDQQDLNRVREALTTLDLLLVKTRYASGDKITLADLALLVTVGTLDALGLDYTRFHQVRRWSRAVKDQLSEHYEVANRTGQDAFAQLVRSRRQQIRNKK